MRISLFIICALFAFLSSYPSFALDEDEETARNLLSLSKASEVQRLKKGGEALNKELRKEVQESVDEIMSQGEVKKPKEIIRILKTTVFGLEEYLQKDPSRIEQLRRCVDYYKGRYVKGSQQYQTLQKVTKAPATHQTVPTQISTRSSFSTETQPRDYPGLSQRLPSLSEFFPYSFHSMMLSPINTSSSTNRLPPISIFLSTGNILPLVSSFDSRDSQDPTRITLPSFSGWDEFDLTQEDCLI